MNEWISVKDRLPEPPETIFGNNNFLVTIKTRYPLLDDEDNISIWVACARYDYFQKIWWIDEEEGINALMPEDELLNLISGSGESCITHWMPLPEPPKEE